MENARVKGQSLAVPPLASPKPKKEIVLKVLPWVVPVALLVLWQVAVTQKWITSSFVPAPSAVLAQGVTLFKSGELLTNVEISLYRAAMGFLIGGAIGFVAGFFSGVSRVFRATFDSTIQMFRNIPHLALIPLIILMLGINESAKITLVAIGVMFPIYINTYHGISSIDPDLIEMGKSYGLNRWQQFRRIIFPGAMPTILMGIRYALGTMWVTLIVAETVSADSGIGYMSNQAQQFMNVKTIYLCILIYALLGKLSDVIAKQLEALLLEWRDAR